MELHPRTRAISLGRPHGPGEPLNAPIFAVSTYALGGDRNYARASGTPTWEAAEEIIGNLEGGRALLFASGMGAVAAALEFVPVGGRVAVPSDCYLGTAGLLRRGAARGRWQVSWLDPTDTAAFVAALGDHDVVWLESPTNPMMRIMDLPTILGAPRSPSCRTVVDNTFSTPLSVRPHDLGADIVVHSATKYFGGHSDLMAGAVVARSEHDAADLAAVRMLHGGTPGMLEAFLVTRGLRTMALRLEAASANALELAKRLSTHPGVERVRYPGLPTHPGHGLAATFQGSFGAMLSFEVRGGREAADRVCRQVALIGHATSLGGVESTIERRGATPGQEHVPAGLLRMSVGCEHIEDLWRDLDRAMAAAGIR